jgi:hypothetical protein
LATFAACLPNAVLTDFGRWAIVRFRFAAAAAFLMFLLAADLCFALAMGPPTMPHMDALLGSSVGDSEIRQTG